MYFIIDFLLVDLSDYDKFGIAFPLGVFITLLAVALIFTVFFIYYKKAATSTLISKLLRKNATSEVAALTLDELKINTLPIRLLISGGGKISQLVIQVGKENLSYEEYNALTKKKGYKEEKTDFSTARFYLSPDMLAEAKTEVKYNTGTILQPIIIAVAILLLWVLLAIFTDDLLYLINSNIK